MYDYYKILGVDKSSSHEEIKQAYRKLAMKHHPDRNGGDDVEFKKIQQAYDVIGNETSRKEYDNKTTSNFQQFGGMPYGFNDFISKMFGNHQFEDIFSRQYQQEKNKHVNLKISIKLQDVLSGKNFVISVKLPSGKDQLVDINIPPGIENNATIRYRNIGDDSIPTVPRGDILLTVSVEDDPHYQRRGADLVKTIEVSIWDALLGASLIIDTLDKKQLEVTIPPGLQPGQIVALTGQGLPVYNSNQKGRLLLHCNVKIPVLLTNKQRVLLEQARDQKD